MKESALSRIIRRSGRKPSFCKCQKCKEQCKTPCLRTPDDIKRLIDRGYKELLMPTHWMVGMVLGKLDYTIPMVQAIQTEEGWCIFHKEGLCELHDMGIKPTEGKLSHHSISPENYTFRKGLAYNVAKEWLSPENEKVIKEIFELYT